MLKVDNFSYAYPKSKQCVLVDISLSLQAGSFNVICGPSGAGKSTLCKAIAGIVPNYYGGGYTGDILIAGHSNIGAKIADTAVDVGIVLDDYESQLVSLTVQEELAFSLQNRGVDTEDIESIIPEVLTAVGLEGRESYQLDELSGGQRQRLVIASVIATKPKILVLDEPVSALDPAGAAELYKIINDLRTHYNMTVVVVEHTLNYVLPYMQKLIIMRDAQVCAQGDIQDVMKYMYADQEFRLLLPDLWQTKLSLEQSLQVEFSNWRTSPQAIDELHNFLGDVKRGNYLEEEYIKPNTDTIISLRAANFAYRTGEEILKDINLNIRSGEFVALLGQNGSGKTTLSRLIMALNAARSGKVLVDGENVCKMEPADLADTIGYVFQNPDLQILEDTVFDEVAYGAKIKGYKGAELEKMVNDALQATGLLHLAKVYPRILSFGQKRRLGIAAALVRKPKVLILDEITSGQDNVEKHLIMSYLKKLNTQEGLTIILITHDMPTVLRYASRVITLKQGKLVFDGSVQEFFSGRYPLGEWEIRMPSIAQLGNYFSLPNTGVQQFVTGFIELQGGQN